MQRDTPIRFAIALSLSVPFWLPGVAAAQLSGASRSKPSAAQPASAHVDTAVPVPTAPPTPAEQPARRAEVTYSQGQLVVAANNSSLNQILREISRETGLKITGSVADERVFGKYGPSPTAEVLTSLLDGTGSNMLLLHSDASSPGELILTPRQGGVTPPNPNAHGVDDDAAEEAPAPRPQPAPLVATPVAPAAPANAAAPATPATGQPGSTPSATDQTDPNAVKTPQQIFQQLQRMRQQSQQ